MTAVVLRDLVRRFVPGGPPAVDGVSLALESGTLTALLGPSGCGKSTVMKLIAGILAPDAGDVRLDGASILALPPERRGTAMMFQSALLFPSMTVAENVGFGLRMRGLPRAQIAARVAEMLALVQLPDLGDRRPAELSGGQAQRVSLARALIVAPRVLLLDEPFSSLDAHLREEMRALVRQVQRATGITTLYITHDQEDAVATADRVALMLRGRVRQHAAPAEFYRRPADAEVAAFFGARNLIPGRAEAGAFAAPFGRLALPAGAAEGAGVLTFRPEALRLGPAAENAFAARLVERRDLGREMRLVFDAGGVRIEARLPPGTAEALAEGAGATLHIPRDSLWLMPPAP